ncbi:Actin-related 4 [Hyphodiscus hymeniophilus]|uniref:Actin-related 4 n=1 Tax=Hyphodiscus hymeniophilus TaxID=353542 RepID=A0A9P6SQ14_9HELO|nr:Actin-related 4 [Hyphodiscus hymeniophilus]
MSISSGPAHRSVSSIRPQPTVNQGPPASPQTPLRTISSTYGSPSSLRAEEDVVVIEIGSRYMRAGFAGDATPKAVVGFGPEEQRRAGDFRKWEVGYDKNWRSRIVGKEWGDGQEIWKPDLRNVDLGLVGDKIERAIRVAYTRHLLTDSRPRRMALILPSALPLPLLSTILDTLFINFQPPNVSLMSAPVLTTISAGLRAAMVVDIGWSETTVTGIYEYREVGCNRSIRASKLLGEEMFKLLAQLVDPTAFKDSVEINRERRNLLSFEECEEVIARMAWCKAAMRADTEEPTHGLTPVKEEDELRSSMRSMNMSSHDDMNEIISIFLTSTSPPKTIRLPFSKLAEPCETTFFAAGRMAQDLDDEELPLHTLIYQSLLQLPVDIRSVCMSRIIFVGGGSKILGLKERILDEVASLVQRRGWDPVQGRAVEQFRENPKLQQSRSKRASIGPTEISPVDSSSKPKTIAALLEQEPDPIEEGLKREAGKGLRVVDQGYLRAVESLGAWSGGSLISQLKIPTVSIIDREQWLQHGATGASRDAEISMATSRQSMGPGSFKSADRSSWTLGLWG